MTLTAELLQQIIDGCEGVTPGPWRAYRHPSHNGQIQIGAGEVEGGGDGWDDWCVAATFEASEPGELDAIHIARLDPATVKAMAQLALQAIGEGESNV